MRIIDADEVVEKQRSIMKTLYGGSIETLKEHMDIDDGYSVPIHTMESYSKAKQFYFGLKGILERTKTVDAVPVVRCCDCKFRDGDPGQPNIQCANMHDDDFCSYGERRDGE